MREVEAYRRFKYVSHLTLPSTLTYQADIPTSFASWQVHLLITWPLSWLTTRKGLCYCPRSRRGWKDSLSLPSSVQGTVFELSLARGYSITSSGVTYKTPSMQTLSTTPLFPRRKFSACLKAPAKPSGQCMTTAPLSIPVRRTYLPLYHLLPFQHLLLFLAAGRLETRASAALRERMTTRMMITTSGSPERQKMDTRMIPKHHSLQRPTNQTSCLTATKSYTTHSSSNNNNNNNQTGRDRMTRRFTCRMRTGTSSQGKSRPIRECISNPAWRLGTS